VRRRAWLALALPLATGGLWGCASTPSVRPPDPAAETVSGRLSVQVAAHGSQAARSVNADFDLRGGAQQGELQLATPLGTVLAQARWMPGEVWLKQSGSERRFGSLSALADEVLGEPLPLDALFDWLRGRPWSGAPSTRRAGGFDQLGWSVDLARWAEGLVTAQRAAAAHAPAVVVKAKLAS
jgi:outer membrane lipoprotein LolB